MDDDPDTDPSTGVLDVRRGAETHMAIKGRQWRRSDPALDETTRQMLVDELMNARRGVKAAKRAGDDDALSATRARVNDAKIALGERGPFWWAPMSSDDVDVRVAATTRALGRQTGQAVDTDHVRHLLRLGTEV